MPADRARSGPTQTPEYRVLGVRTSARSPV